MDYEPADRSPSQTLPHKPTRRPFPTRLVIVVVLWACAVLLGGTALLVSELRGVPVTLIVSGDARPMRTRAATVGALLEQSGITLGANDRIDPPLDAPIRADLVIRLELARSVTLTIDGHTRIFWTPYTNPADILRSEGVSLGDSDRLFIDGTLFSPAELPLYPVPARTISIRRSLPIVIVDDASARDVRTTAATVGDALFEAGVTLTLADSVTPPLTERVTADMRITVERAESVRVRVDDSILPVRVRGATVRDALAAAGVVLVGQDYTIPDESAALAPDLLIRVVRVRETWLTEDVPVAHQTVYVADADLDLDQIVVDSAGADGVERTWLRVRFEDGDEVRRERDETQIVTPPQDRVVRYGTRVTVRTVETPDGTRAYWRVVRMYATSYHPAALGGDNITATGAQLRKGIVAADRGVLPFGTEVFVPGYGVGVVADTGGPRQSRRWIDLGYSDDDWVSWSRSVDVYLLTPVPAEIDYILP